MPYRDSERKKDLNRMAYLKKKGSEKGSEIKTPGKIKTPKVKKIQTPDRPFPKIGEMLFHPDGRFAGRHGVDRDDLSRFDLDVSRMKEFRADPGYPKDRPSNAVHKVNDRNFWLSLEERKRLWVSMMGERENVGDLGKAREVMGGA